MKARRKKIELVVILFFTHCRAEEVSHLRMDHTGTVLGNVYVTYVCVVCHHSYVSLPKW